MKKFKLVSIFMALFILLLSLAACSGSSEETTSSKGSEKEEPATEEPAEEPAEEAVDLGGRTIRIANHWDMTPVGGTEYGDATVARVTEVEEKYNVKIEYVVVPWEEKMNKFTSTVMAGEPFADLVSVTSTQAMSLLQNDYIIAIDDIIDVNSTPIPETNKQLGTLNEKFYMLTHQANQSGGMAYNKAMFEAAGLEDPYELQQKGEWTWAAMLDAAKKLTTDTDGDGTIDQFGLSADPNLIAEYSVMSNGGQYLDTATGEVKIDSPEAIESYEFMASLYNEHKVIKPNEGDNYNDPRNFFTEGKVAMTQAFVWESEGRAETPFEWGYVFWPKGPKATDYAIPVANFEGITIPAGVENPEVVYQIWEDLQLWEYAESSVEEWFLNVQPSEEAVDTALQMIQKMNVNYWPAYNLEDAFYAMNESIATGAESPSQAIAKVKDEAQARVDEFLGK